MTGWSVDKAMCQLELDKQFTIKLKLIRKTFGHPCSECCNLSNNGHGQCDVENVSWELTI